MIDPIDNMLYVISKREFRSTVYGAEVFTNVKQQYFTLNRIAELPFTFATASAIDPTGTQLLVKNITHIFYWQRTEVNLEAGTATKASYSALSGRATGEAIAFDSNGTGFYTISERPFGLKSFYFFERNQ
jgi:hypothetical protein